MVEKGFQPEPEEKNVEPAPRTRAGEFLADWLARRAERKAEEESDDSDSISNRWRKALSRLFPSIAEKQEVTDEPEQPTLFDGLFSREPATEVVEATESTETPEEFEYVIPHEDEQITDAEEPLSIEREEHAAPEVSEPAMTETAPAPEAVIQESADIPLERSEPVATERTLYERAPEPIERILERRSDRAAAAAFIGAEASSRWRDRKIKKRVTRLEQSDRKEAARVMTLEERLDKAHTEMVELRRARERQEEERQAMIEKRTGVKQEVETVERLEKAPKIERQRIVSTREAPPVIKPEAPVPPPEVIFEKVVDAAEHDEAIERKYERRQEVKDEPTAVHAFGGVLNGGAASIGSVLTHTVQDVPLSQRQRKELAKAADKMHKTQAGGMYRQAAVGGFWTGVVILVAIAVVAFTT